MKKINWLLALVMLFCIFALAASVYAVDGGADYGRGRETDPVAGALLEGKIGSTASVLDLSRTTTTATNLATLTVGAGVTVVTSQGSVSANTNTITLANPGAGVAGRMCIIVNASASTNLLAIAKTGNYAGPAVELAAGESVLIVASATNQWVGIGQ